MAVDTMGVELCGAEDCFGGPEEVSRKDGGGHGNTKGRAAGGEEKGK
jgi:hypothetical protein